MSCTFLTVPPIHLPPTSLNPFHPTDADSSQSEQNKILARVAELNRTKWELELVLFKREEEVGLAPLSPQERFDLVQKLRAKYLSLCDETLPLLEAKIAEMTTSEDSAPSGTRPHHDG